MKKIIEPTGSFSARRAHPEARRAEGSIEILRRFAPQDEQSNRRKNSPTAQIIVFLLVTGALVLWCTFSTEGQMSESKSVVMIIASSNFRDEELLQPKAVLEEEGVKVSVASTVKGKVRGMLGATVSADMLVADIDISQYDAIIFVGGTGSSEYWNSPVAHRLIKEAVRSNKLVGAICIAPVTLANAGILSGKKATVFRSEAGKLKAAGCVYTGESVSVDGNVVTADGPTSARQFGSAILDKLKGK